MAQKYIIGDLVKYKVGGLEFIAEITNTSKYGYCFKGVSDDISGTLCKEFAKDIPLTPEILEKNGWKYFGNRLYWSPNEEGVGVCLSSQTGYVWKAYIGRHIIRSNINSVSDLQHLLFGLGLNLEMEV